MSKIQRKKRESFKVAFIIVCLVLSTFQAQVLATNYYQQVETQPKLKRGLEEFLTHIFTLLPAQVLSNLIGTITLQSKDDQEIYRRLIKALPSVTTKAARPSHPFAYRIKLFYRSFQSLTQQVDEMTRQTKQLVKTKSIQGYLEIGTPGRYVKSLKKALNISGPFFIMPSPQTSFALFERKSLLSIGKTIPLTYQPINTATIPNESLDLVTCYIGLHHIPPALLDGFISSLHRILRKGGMLIIRDHNRTEELNPLLHVVHSVYNAVTGVSKKDECAEIRNFQPLQFWIDTVTTHGFSVSSTHLLQKNDPTQNTLLCFTKQASSQNEDDVISLKKEILPHEKEPYERELVATYLTPIEWRSVDEIQNLSLFLNHTPWYQYPYLKSIGSFWKHTTANTQAARRLCGTQQAFFSSAAITNFFIGSVMTGLYAQLSLLSVGPRLMYSLPGNADALTVKAIIFDSHEKLLTFEHPKIKTLKRYKTGITLIELPRYLPFTELIQKLVAQDIVIVEIAGHKELCIQVQAPSSTATLTLPKQCTMLHTTPPLQGKEAFPRTEVKVPMAQLKAFFEAVRHGDYSVVHIFDY